MYFYFSSDSKRVELSRAGYCISYTTTSTDPPKNWQPNQPPVMEHRRGEAGRRPGAAPRDPRARGHGSLLATGTTRDTPERATNGPKTQGETPTRWLQVFLIIPVNTGDNFGPRILDRPQGANLAPRSVRHPWTCRRDAREPQLLATAGILVVMQGPWSHTSPPRFDYLSFSWLFHYIS